MQIIENQVFDEERALYGSHALTVRNCRFDGPADGESAFKECSYITVEDCFFNLRYPFWHNHGLVIKNSEMTELCRAALWYSESHNHRRGKTSRHQSPAGMQRGFLQRLRHYFSGIRLVNQYHSDG